LISSTLLFYCGMAFAYFVIMPIFFAFITGTAPEGVAVMTDINRYLDFVMTIFFAFGVAFEVPVATVILALASAFSRPRRWPPNGPTSLLAPSSSACC
jgi:sec-independent protein translocase protein TatC